jgi:hypothetical protein
MALPSLYTQPRAQNVGDGVWLWSPMNDIECVDPATLAASSTMNEDDQEALNALGGFVVAGGAVWSIGPYQNLMELHPPASCLAGSS